MSLEPKFNDDNWRPTASLKNLRLRCELINKIRQFFQKRHVLEVETPLLAQHTVTDIHIDSFDTQCSTSQNNYHLQTSPEYAMKRLLAHGSGPIFQICKAFRVGEAGNKHNPEFTMLEWYRLDYSLIQLMDEVDLLLRTILNTSPAKKMSYAALFDQYLNINPHTISYDCLLTLAQHYISMDFMLDSLDKDTLLQLLMSHIIEPNLGKHTPIFIYDYPASQAALAVIRKDQPPVAERFELFINGLELANGFHELTDAKMQYLRFAEDQLKREKKHLKPITIDKYLMSALHAGLPQCSGVAIGLDRILMLCANTTNIQDIIAFPWDRA